MAEGVDDINKSDAATIFSTVINFENPQRLVSPTGFRDIVLTIIGNGIQKKIQLTSFLSHSSCDCADFNTCSECLLPITLSALEALFNSFQERNLASTLTDTTLKHNSQDPGHCDPTTAMAKWYQDTALLLSSSCIIDLLVECLFSSCKFTSFLAKKTILSGISVQNIETSKVLSLLKQYWHDGLHTCVPLLEILKDMMSLRRFPDRQVNCKTFSLLKELKLQNFIETKCSENITNFDTSGLLEYLSLLHKVMKYGMSRCEKSKIPDIFFISEIVKDTLLPFGDYFFLATESNKGHLICLEYVKTIGTFLDIRFLEDRFTLENCVLEISASLQTQVSRYLNMAYDNNLLLSVNFVGNILSSEDKNNSVCVSSLKRQLVLLSLKTCAITLKGMKDSGIDGAFECFWDSVGFTNRCTSGQLTKDWLPVIFADQDDQWITALFCLLIIDRELRKWLGEKHEQLIKVLTTSSRELSLKDMQKTICPHRLFLQLAEFIDYDHLVLADFLTSPETPFLSYFTQYLHIMSEDWHVFLSVCCETCESTEQVVLLPEFSTTETSRQADLTQDFVRISQRVPNVVPQPKSSREVSSQCSGYFHNVQTVPSSHSAEQSHDTQHSSLVPCSGNFYSKAVSNDVLHSSTTVSHDPLLTSPSITSTMFKSPTHNYDDDLYNSSPLPDELIQNSSIRQSLKHEYSLTEDQRNETGSTLYGGINANNFLSLVAYSDSDSEDFMKETDVCVTSSKQSLKWHLFDSDGSTYKGGNQIQRHTNECQSSGSEVGSVVSEHDSSSDQTEDKILKCSSQLDIIMGMLIRLRLHIERLGKSNLFPYNAKPLLLLLEACEELYEKPSESSF